MIYKSLTNFQSRTFRLVFKPSSAQYINNFLDLLSDERINFILEMCGWNVYGVSNSESQCKIRSTSCRIYL